MGLLSMTDLRDDSLLKVDGRGKRVPWRDRATRRDVSDVPITWRWLSAAAIPRRR